MTTRSHLKTAIAILCAVIAAGAIYVYYQRTQVNQERLRNDTRHIEAMLSESHENRH
jgi:hypothetical protein